MPLSEKDLQFCKQSGFHDPFSMTYQPPTVTKIVKSCLIDFRFAVSLNRLDGVDESIVTIS